MRARLSINGSWREIASMTELPDAATAELVGPSPPGLSAAATLDEVWRVLAPGGMAMISFDGHDPDGVIEAAVARGLVVYGCGRVGQVRALVRRP